MDLATSRLCLIARKGNATRRRACTRLNRRFSPAVRSRSGNNRTVFPAGMSTIDYRSRWEKIGDNAEGSERQKRGKKFLFHSGKKSARMQSFASIAVQFYRVSQPSFSFNRVHTGAKLGHVELIFELNIQCVVRLYRAIDHAVLRCVASRCIDRERRYAFTSMRVWSRDRAPPSMDL